MTDPSRLAITLARISTHPMWANYQEYAGDQDAIKEASQILANLTTEWGVRSPEGTVVTKAEPFARKRYADDPDFWTLVNRQVASTDWKVVTE